MTRGMKRLICLIAAAAGTVACVQASFFMRWRKAPVESQIEQLGGQVLQEEAVEVNGVGGVFQCYGFDRPASEVAPGMRNLFGLPETTLGGSAMATRLHGAEEQTCIFLPVREGALALVFRRPAKGEREAVWPAGLPGFSGITPAFSAVCGNGDLLFGVGSSGFSSTVALAQAADELRAAGWTPLVPAGSLRWFSKGKEICLVMAHDAPGGAGTRLTALVRRQG